VNTSSMPEAIRKQSNAQEVSRSVSEDLYIKHLNTEASAVLASIGLMVSDAVRLMLKRVVAEKALPFEPLVPNAETIEAIKAARRGELNTDSSVKNLFNALNADD
jgi:DNA-damage-inducible protein J